MSTGSDYRSKTIDYALREEVSPQYRMMRIQLNNFASSSFTADNSQQLLEFKLPSNAVYNLARSYISYTMPIPSNALANWTHEDTFTLATDVSFGTAGGTNLADLKFVGNYVKIARKLNTKVDDMIANDKESQLYSCNDAVATNYYPSALNVNATVNYIESKYSISLGAATLYNKQVAFPLNGLSNTIFSYDKDLFFGNEMFIRMQSTPLNRQAWRATNGADPVAGEADIATQPINNIYLYLAVEKNEIINAAIRQKFDAGTFKINMPYTVAYSQSSTVAGANNINFQITKQYGKRLLQLLYTTYNTVNVRGKAWDANNRNGIKVAAYRTALDSNYLQDYTLSCLDPTASGINSDDWFVSNRKHCKDTAIMNRDVYRLNWFHLDKFYESNEDIEDDNLDVGLPLPAVTLNYIVETVTATAALTHYIFATFRRSAILNKDGVFYEAS